MSRENVENARKGFETYNAHGIRVAAQDYWHPDIEWEAGPWAVPLSGETRWQGRQKGVEAFEELESILGRFSVEVVEALDAGDQVFVEARLHAEGVHSGAAVDQTFWYAIRFEDGRQRRNRVFGTREEALEAAGLRPT
jgi:ketosteroid isomerase-like protein